MFDKVNTYYKQLSVIMRNAVNFLLHLFPRFVKVKSVFTPLQFQSHRHMMVFYGVSWEKLNGEIPKQACNEGGHGASHTPGKNIVGKSCILIGKSWILSENPMSFGYVLRLLDKQYNFIAIKNSSLVCSRQYHQCIEKCRLFKLRSLGSLRSNFE